MLAHYCLSLLPKLVTTTLIGKRAAAIENALKLPDLPDEFNLFPEIFRMDLQLSR